MPTCPQCHADHRGLCHVCVHNGKVGGEYQQSPCARCKTAEALQQGHGRNVSYDELAGVLGERQHEAAEEKDDVTLDALRVFLSLDAVGREIVFRYLSEPETTLQEVASYLSETFRRPFTLQAVHWRIKVMGRQSEALGRMLARVDGRTG